MQKATVKSRALLPFLVAAAVLALALVLFFSIRGSADEPTDEIEDFAFQTVQGDSLGSSSTSLRFLFTVGSLDYIRVGFVASRTNPDPTVGGAGCSVSETTDVYSAVRADGKLISAPAGRYWVVIRVDNVPNANFGDPIYIKPYVEDGSGVRYGAVRNLSVEGAFTIPTLQTEIASFTDSNFGGGSVTTDLGNMWSDPPVNPTEGQHPRVLFNYSDIAGIKTALGNNKNQAAADEYLAALAAPTDGDLGPAEDRDDGFHNYDQKVLADITALALDYQLTGNLLSGYRAVYAAKNLLKTMSFDGLDEGVDRERHFGIVMYTMACVYDWCHDLLTAADKEQIVLGVQKKCCEGKTKNGDRMEIGFPPSMQSPVTDHGCEFQLLRDYLSFAIAIYDEYPGWWDYIGGRFYQQYVPVRNEFYAAGMVPQGTSQYIQIRFAADLYSALLIEAATGAFPYASRDNMKQVMHTVYEYALMKDTEGGKMMFGSGDGSYAGRKLGNFGTCSLLASHLFDDSNARAYLESNLFGGVSYTKFSDGFFQCFPTEELICSSGGVTAYANRNQGLFPIVYNGGWLGQIIAHNGWSGKGGQAATLMKIGVRSAAGHEHQDAGQFQIFYKGILAGDSGSYATYGSDHHKYYHQATIAHNSLLIYNTSRSSTNKGYYSGGQRVLSEPQSLDNWHIADYKTGTVTGYQYQNGAGWSDKSVYAYIAGDITPAYDSDTVTDVNRRMLTVFDTGNEDVPMYFFVFDSITATSGSYKKTFLLHTVTEPEISGKKVTVTNGEGRLVLQNLLGGDSIVKRGGSGENYKVNNGSVDSYKQLTPNRNPDDGYWGRVEISPNTGSATNQLLNVMYVCDAANDPDLTATRFCSSEVEGARIGNTAVVFVKSSTRRGAGFTFTTGGDGTFNYYVSGVEAGEWLLTVNGVITDILSATADGGLLTFTAPAGTIGLTRSGEDSIEWYSSLPEGEWDSFGFSDLVP
ncbi:MAG: heparinase II/III family protein [Clostridia bacterium]|nr:heparinase II/III family protein [Clostridia bacterium]